MDKKGYSAKPIDIQNIPGRTRGSKTTAWATRLLDDFQCSNDLCWEVLETQSFGRIDNTRKLKTVYQSLRNNIKYHQRDMFATMRSGRVFVIKGKDPDGHEGHQTSNIPFTRTKQSRNKQ